VKRILATNFAVLILAVAFTGCAFSGSQPQHAASAYSYDVPSSTFRLRGAPAALHGPTRSWMKSDAVESQLLYVSSEMTRDVNVYSFPQGKPEGVLTGATQPLGLCSDAKGDVFVPDYAESDIVEYAHGGTTPIATLSDANQDPESCAVDPKTGTLAVANELSSQFGAGSIALYRNAAGSPTLVQDPDMRLVVECGYDNMGNLFVDGFSNFPSGGGVFTYAEFPKGKDTSKTIKLNKKIGAPGAIQWDGRFLTVADASNGVIYRTNGAPGKIESTIKLAGVNTDNQTYIQGKTVIAPGYYSIHTGFWHYPSGGASFKSLKIGSPYGVTVSVAGN
jgi:hypothetical protein